MSLNCGHVYHLFLPLAGKNKLLVPAYVQSATGKVRFFVINTERTDYQRRTPAIANHIIPILRVDNPVFLTHDSWLNCSETVGGYTVLDIDAITGCYRGPLDNATLIAVRATIVHSRLYSFNEITSFAAQWPVP